MDIFRFQTEHMTEEQINGKNMPVFCFEMHLLQTCEIVSHKGVHKK